MPPPHTHILNILRSSVPSHFFLDIGEVPEEAEDDPEEGDGDGRQEEELCPVSVEQRRGERRDQRSTVFWPGRAEESRESCSVILARTESSYYHVQLLFSPGPGRSHQPLALKLTFQLPPWVRGERTRRRDLGRPRNLHTDLPRWCGNISSQF